jgi:hypothetical protein
MGRINFLCTTSSVLGEIGQIKREMQAVGDAFGLSIQTSELPNGIQVEVSPKPGLPSTEKIAKMTLEVRTIRKGMLVTVVVHFSSPIDEMLSFAPVDGNSPEIKNITKLVEDITRAAKGNCRLL